MRKDIEIPKSENVGVAVAEERIGPDGPEYGVYLINLNNFDLENVLVTSSGVGEKDGRPVKTGILRHFLNDVVSRSFAKVEAIVPEVFGLSNEYFVTYFQGDKLFEKKCTFVSGTLQASNYMRLPLLNLHGVLII